MTVISERSASSAIPHSPPVSAGGQPRTAASPPPSERAALSFHLLEPLLLRHQRLVVPLLVRVRVLQLLLHHLQIGRQRVLLLLRRLQLRRRLRLATLEVRDPRAELARLLVGVASMRFSFSSSCFACTSAWNVESGVRGGVRGGMRGGVWAASRLERLLRLDCFCCAFACSSAASKLCSSATIAASSAEAALAQRAQRRLRRHAASPPSTPPPRHLRVRRRLRLRRPSPPSASPPRPAPSPRRRRRRRRRPPQRSRSARRGACSLRELLDADDCAASWPLSLSIVSAPPSPPPSASPRPAPSPRA